MSGGPQSDPSGRPLEPRPGGERSWQHPSEVGLATRGRSDRRRAALLAAGVVIGGIGLLVSGVFLGSAHRSEDDPAPDAPIDKLSSSVAHVTVVRGSGTTVVTGLVLDEAGHVLVPADSVAESDEIWARCAEGASELVAVIGTDPSTNLSVLQLGTPDGSPANTSTAPPEVGVEVVTVHARAGMDLAMSSGRITSTDAASPESSVPSQGPGEEFFWAEVSDRPEGGSAPVSSELSGGLVFDRGGRFIGMTTTTAPPAGNSTNSGSSSRTSLVEVMSAEAALGVAGGIIAGD